MQLRKTPPRAAHPFAQNDDSFNQESAYDHFTRSMLAQPSCQQPACRNTRVSSASIVSACDSFDLARKPATLTFRTSEKSQLKKKCQKAKRSEPLILLMLVKIGRGEGQC